MEIAVRTQTPIVSASHPLTNQVIYTLAEPLLPTCHRILDLGCGQGHMTQRLATGLGRLQRPPNQILQACDLFPEGYACPEIPFIQADLNRPLPFDDATFDLIVAVEVMEHIHRFYDLLMECTRILRPGAVLIFSVPNILHMNARLSFLMTGFYDMYIVPTIDSAKAGRLCGHVMPLSLAYLAYGLRRAGFTDISIHPDKRKKSATALALLCHPLLKLGSWWYDRKIQNYDVQVHAENRAILAAMNGFDMLTARSCILKARKPT
ncbi:MAG: class I SAM-dependent methyltransferase [Magnetococcales bacterium]|nr:class I SAM-dependent methyltransferase [Magnetococcales bacterium]